MNYQVFWTEEALANVESIIQYISSTWMEREVLNFKRKLSEQINIISRFPNVFPASTFAPRLRKAVLTKQTTIFYEVKEQAIYIVYLFDSRQNPQNIR
ncbi:type II toxin-antitoxin system RelE/ParE family toxin [Rufibacter sp. LB8]|uniref:type II toxin-antitoxin system RelE/ParE family toxin n=1 Tax=Rufibacter sp. LB8 TaxID=2777781 RepID=UPI00178C1A0B|nr:type II toxin-antitoxin system RelE/ParE family toxin [Rufibacter sp. LB8]